MAGVIKFLSDNERGDYLEKFDEENSSLQEKTELELRLSQRWS
jgi:hypothetical protein